MRNTALLVVDVQNALVLAKPFAVEEVISNIKKLIKTCREKNVEVIYIQHTDKIGGELEPNSEGWKIYGEISPAINETVISKTFNSAFKETILKDYLDNKGINKLIMTGMQTEYCFDTTCKVAFEYGFKLIIPEKTNTTFNNGNILAKDLYEHYNFNIFNGRFGIVECLDNTIERLIG
ncbi:cysteine hydrolase [Clostridium sp. CM028]|uniref:cysteine hydrolase family protein n=1 Tax=unclassified Clostridium TaxID=2614128 RepID=UPI001C0DB60C|nr:MULTISPECIES: cysteine hydrolase family protein [unclassified Clostridium]MBU3092886.1 cysteine hydrolase [Clostridium sp. CF011]MBW9146633.1 cysteine hydrolase [Clostridium sp. CM027]MBW9149072.1 cysteine hydrolase [Clostridium sp. CM028]UVE42047.1 cysteine hydrolase [Clostridium sp. CM027]WAG71070.1 cysteine hydrolase [Clostridium sp. CF011]